MSRSILPATLLVASLSLGASGQRWAVAEFPSGAEFTLEVAVSAAERARGYMFREKVGPDEGMLFLFDENGRHGFWMKNCRVALDIIWLDEDFRVVEIAHEQQPCPESGPCRTVTPLRSARYVLEVAGGVARAKELETGNRLIVIAEPPIP